MKILCVYSTRQIDSNLFMSSTKFDGLQKCGYKVDIIFCGIGVVCDQFGERYAHFFDRVCYLRLIESCAAKYMVRHEKLKVLYRYYREVLVDPLLPPVTKKHKKQLSRFISDKYDAILAFIPNPLAGFLAEYIKKNFLPNTRLIQFWTDPISLGRCDTIYERPKSRWLQGIVEKKLLGFGDKVVFCYPLLCDSMKELYPECAEKMFWGDTSYVKHEKANYKTNNKIITIGCFGAYQKRVRNIYPFLNSMNHFPDVNFVLRGDSDILIDKNLYSNLDIEQGRQPIDIIEEMEANCDILVCLAGLSGLTIPAGKVFYYGDYNKPILYISDGRNKDYASEYIRGFNRYVVCDNNEKSIIAGIQECIDLLPDYEVSIPERMQPEVIAKKFFE